MPGRCLLNSFSCETILKSQTTIQNGGLFNEDGAFLAKWLLVIRRSNFENIYILYIYIYIIIIFIYIYRHGSVCDNSIFYIDIFVHPSLSPEVRGSPTSGRTHGDPTGRPRSIEQSETLGQVQLGEMSLLVLNVGNRGMIQSKL